MIYVTVYVSCLWAVKMLSYLNSESNKYVYIVICCVINTSVVHMIITDLMVSLTVIYVINNFLYNRCIDVCYYTIVSLLFYVVNILNN